MITPSEAMILNYRNPQATMIYASLV